MSQHKHVSYLWNDAEAAKLDPVARLDFVGDVELKLGVAFRDEDVEFLETPSDLIERGAEILIRGGAR